MIWAASRPCGGLKTLLQARIFTVSGKLLWTGTLVVVRDIRENFRKSCIFRERKQSRKKPFFLWENHDCDGTNDGFLSNRKLLQKIGVKILLILGWKKTFSAIYK